MVESTGTTRPRKRAPAKSTSKTAPAAAKPAPKAENAPAVVVDGDKTKVQFDLDFEGDTKSYAKFKVPLGNGCVGSIYAPIGTETVKVLLIGPANSAE